MKKKTLVTVIAIILTIAGYFAGDITNESEQNASTEQVSTTQASTTKASTAKVSTAKTNTTQANTATASASTTDPNLISEIPSLIKDAVLGGLNPGEYIMAGVIKVTDGDTFDIKYKNEEYKVRMLDIDTPESVKSGVPVQEYSKEAYEFVNGLIYQKEVKLVFEKGIRDRYNRLLAHVVLIDGTYLNSVLVLKGFARVEFYSPNTKLKDYFNKLLQQAISAKVGIWSLPKNRQPFVIDETGKYVPRYYEKAAS